MRTICLLLSAMLLLSACGSGVNPDNSTATESSSNSQFEGSENFEASAKEIKLDYDPLPSLGNNGELPRAHAAFTLLEQAPENGKPYTRGRVFFMEDSSNGRRVRIFSRDDQIFRIASYTPLESRIEEDILQLLSSVEEQYGKPAEKLQRELIYVDQHTIMTIRIGGRYLITEIADGEMTDLAQHVKDIWQKNRK